MGKFSMEVQAEAVVGPLRSGFKPSVWRTEYQRLGEDDVDKNLFEAGLLIFEKANNIRAGLKLTFSKAFRATTKIRAFAAFANYNLCVVKKKTREAMTALAENSKTDCPDATVMAHEYAAVKLEMPIGAEYGPDEIIQAMVDGAQVPLKRILEHNPALAGNAEFGKLDWNEVQMDFNLGVTYSHIEGLWDDCLWNSYSADSDGQLVTFSPRDIAWQARETISRARYNNLSNEFAMHSFHAYLELLYSGRLPPHGPMCVKTLKRNGKRHEIQLAKFDAESQDVKWLLTMRSYASEPYYVELLNEAQPILKGASLDQLLAAWTVSSSAADVLLKEVEVLTSAKPTDPKTWLPQYAPVLQMDALARAVTTVSACSYSQATAILEFLTFRGKNDQELWTQPLLPVSQEAVIPFFAAISSPNLRRLVDVWLKQLGVDLSLRGPAFETHIREAMRLDIKQSPLLASSSVCLSKHLKFTPAGEREEEIDIVAIIGDVLIIGEAKCFLEPAEAKEIARHREKVLDAVAQVKRKANAVERHKQAFRLRAADVGLTLPATFRVQPLVVLNNAIHVGIAVEGIPIVDEYILGVFFRGKFVEIALKEGDKPFQPVKTRVLYGSPEEAAQALPAFLSTPPQMEPLLKGLSRRWVPVPAVNENDWFGRFLAVSCVPNVKSSAKDEG